MTVGATSASPLTNPLVAGRYRLGAPLGSGGAAVVWQGWDTHVGRAVALKAGRAVERDEGESDPGQNFDRAMVVPRERSAGPNTLAALRWRLKREERVMSLLAHPNIAQVYEYLEVEGRPWLALELVEGLDLRRGASERGPLSILDALDVGRQMCAALAAIHAAGVIHRDVKPQNIILSPSGHATLIDFDLAWTPTLRDAGEPGMVYGTPEYMAPEQAMGEPITMATDLYALGVTLYELLAGSAPFHSGRASAIMWRHVTETPPPLREWREDLPAPVERAVMRALAKEPRRRYQSAEAMEQALAQAQDAARLAPEKAGTRVVSLPTSVSRTAETAPPIPVIDLPAPAPVLPAPDLVEDRASARWLILTYWALALLGVVLTLVLLAALAEHLPT
jgi:eukaryotic-like serine/threonine-protein kinase